MTGLLERRSAVGILLAIPGAASQFRPVPDAAWRPHGDGQRLRWARPAVPAKVRVDCPCGHRPVVSYGELHRCRHNAAAPHRCSRWFVFTGTSVLVTGGP